MIHLQLNQQCKEYAESIWTDLELSPEKPFNGDLGHYLADATFEHRRRVATQEAYEQQIEQEEIPSLVTETFRQPVIAEIEQKWREVWSSLQQRHSQGKQPYLAIHL
ncbi:MAG: hypothetical protein Q7S06_01770 [Nanoarchaeota archaeon]|nr:hypothetical protein [Nanoarchaeota archaeon]